MADDGDRRSEYADDRDDVLELPLDRVIRSVRAAAAATAPVHDRNRKAPSQLRGHRQAAAPIDKAAMDDQDRWPGR
jgi:hypothetical protein